MDLNIPFKGLKEGKHQFQFHIDDKFFEAFPEGDIHKGDLEIKVDLVKRSTGLETLFAIHGKVVVPCDRCLDDLEQDIDYQGKLFFEFGEETNEVTDDLIMLSANENYLELTQYVYEFVSLSLPFQKFHGNDAKGHSLCNKEMLEKLNKLYSNNEDDEIEDPRWDKLRDLIN